MRYLASYLTPAGAVLMLVCFFLPWLSIGCYPRGGEEGGVRLPEQRLTELSGLDLARARPLFWGIPIAAMAILFFTASRLPVLWRYRLSVLAGFGGLIALAISYENLQQVDATHLTALTRQDAQSRETLERMPYGVRRLVENALQDFERWRGPGSIEVRVDFRQAYSLTWAACVLSILSALAMWMRLSKRQRNRAP